MRIVQLHASYREHGGEDEVVRREAALLESAGHRVEQIITENPSTPLRTLSSLTGSLWNPVQWSSVRRHAVQGEFDVAHVHNTWFSLSPSVLDALGRARVPTVMTLHNYRRMCVNGLLFRDGGPCETCVGGSLWPGIRYACYRDSRPASALVAASETTHRVLMTWAKRVDLFLVLTEFARALFIASGLPPERLWVKPHFVPDPGLRPDPPSSSNRVLYVGRLSEEKGVQVLLDAWKSIEPTDLELVVVGEGPLRDELGSRATHSVRFTGRLEGTEITRLMLSARALVFPSIWYETFGLVLVEAMASGLPVIASHLGGTPEVLAGLPSWSLVQSGSVKAWAEALQAVMDDSAVDQAGDKARAAYLDRYRPEVGLRNLEKAYQMVRD